MELQNLDSNPGILGQSKTEGRVQHKGNLEQRPCSANLGYEANSILNQKVRLELQNLDSTPGILGESKTEGSDQELELQVLKRC